MKTMDDLRKELFDTIGAVRTGKCDIATAKAVSDLSQVIINSAKAEADFARATGRAVISGLIQQDQGEAPLIDDSKATDTERRPTATGVLERSGNVTRHRLK